MNARSAHLSATADSPGDRSVGMAPSELAPALAGSAPVLRWASLRDQPMPCGARPLTERLTGIEGFDLALGLRYTGGQTPMLARALRRFVATYRQGVPMLLDASGDEHEVVLRWRTACHSVRGALSLIGAVPLVEAANELELALRDLASRASLSAQGRQFHEGVAALAARLSAALED